MAYDGRIKDWIPLNADRLYSRVTRCSVVVTPIPSFTLAITHLSLPLFTNTLSVCALSRPKIPHLEAGSRWYASNGPDSPMRLPQIITHRLWSWANRCLLVPTGWWNFNRTNKQDFYRKHHLFEVSLLEHEFTYYPPLKNVVSCFTLLQYGNWKQTMISLKLHSAGFPGRTLINCFHLL